MATTMLPLDTNGLCERADRIVLAKAESQSARWSDDHQTIYTEITLRVERSYKGALKTGDTVVVRSEGGSVDGIGMRVYGAASFKIGEESVVFVEHRGLPSYVVGMAQGKLHVEARADGKRMVAPNLAEIHFTQAPTKDAGAARTLEEMEQEIVKTVDAQKKTPARSGH